MELINFLDNKTRAIISIAQSKFIPTEGGVIILNGTRYNVASVMIDFTNDSFNILIEKC